MPADASPHNDTPAEPEYDLSSLPPLKDLTIENVTENTKLVNSQCKDARTKYVFERLVQHLHDFARETRLSHDEWMNGITFLTQVGQICSNVRQEFILLSDILGLSLLIDSISHPKPPESTAGTVLGPFHTHDAAHLEPGSQLSADADGEPLLCLCRVVDTAGQPVPRCKVDVWETDSHGFYDVQRADRGEPDGRGVLSTDEMGFFWFRSIVPVSYPIPHDGPVGKLLKVLGRHPFRPAHMHFMFEKEGFDRLITALYVRGDPYESSDAVFGVKQSLIVTLGQVASEEMSSKYNVPRWSKLLEWTFVLVTKSEVDDLRDRLAREAMEKLNLGKMSVVDGLPVPEVD